MLRLRLHAPPREARADRGAERVAKLIEIYGLLDSGRALAVGKKAAFVEPVAHKARAT